MAFADIAKRHKLQWALDIIPDSKEPVPDYDDLNIRRKDPTGPPGRRIARWAKDGRAIGARLIPTAALMADEEHIEEIRELTMEVREIPNAAKDPVFRTLYLGQEVAMTTNGGWQPVGPIGTGVFEVGLVPQHPRERIVFSEIIPQIGMDDRTYAHHQRIALLIDALSPLGHGQRGLLIAPPKGGKTTILKTMMVASTQLPDTEVVGIFVRERPEEAAEIPLSMLSLAGESARNIQLCISTYDQKNVKHTVRMVMWTIERMKRYAEVGKKVFCVVDSLTRLARVMKMVYSAKAEGGLDSGGLDDETAKQLQWVFGTFRSLNNGGAITGIGTILTSDDPRNASKFEKVVFELFKGTGNWDMQLNGILAQQGHRPAIDPGNTGTREEELLVPHDILVDIRAWRRRLLTDTGGGPTQVAIKHARAAIKRGATLPEMVNPGKNQVVKEPSLRPAKNGHKEEPEAPVQPFDANKYAHLYKDYTAEEDKYYADPSPDGLNGHPEADNPNWREDLARVNGSS